MQGKHDDFEQLQRETLEVQRRVLGPDSPSTAVSVYNLGCLAAIRSQRDEALRLLREAVDHGLSGAWIQGMESDSDLKSLQGDPRFSALVAYAKQKAAAKSSKQE
jgi:hypothetical protein